MAKVSHGLPIIVQQCKALKKNHKLFLSYLYANADRTDSKDDFEYSDSSINELAQHLNLTRKTIFTLKSFLIRNGIIEVVKRGSKGNPSTYKVRHSRLLLFCKENDTRKHTKRVSRKSTGATDLFFSRNLSDYEILTTKIRCNFRDIKGVNLSDKELASALYREYIDASDTVTLLKQKIDYLHNKNKRLNQELKRYLTKGDLTTGKPISDEFYTTYQDIENELIHYTTKIANKTIYLNCDNFCYSNFWKFFYQNFNKLELKRLVATSYNALGNGIMAEYDGKDILATHLQCNGDFRSDECRNVLEQSDIVITNPPFSLFSDFIDLIVGAQKDFMAIGNVNAITYNSVFSHIQEGTIKFGLNKWRDFKGFVIPDNYNSSGSEVTTEGNIRLVRTNNCCWFTTVMPDDKKKEYFVPESSYVETEYDYVDNTDILFVPSTAKIPQDFNGKMAVPVSALLLLDLSKYEIIDKIDCPFVKGKAKYKRVVITKKGV